MSETSGIAFFYKEGETSFSSFSKISEKNQSILKEKGGENIFEDENF